MLSKLKSCLKVRNLRILLSEVCLKVLFVVLVLLMKSAQKKIYIYLFYQSADTYDCCIVDDADLDDIDENALNFYRKLRERGRGD